MALVRHRNTLMEMLNLPELFGDGGATPLAWHPPVDMREDNDQVFVKMDLPGLTAEDIDISFDGHILSITGKRKEEAEENEGCYWSRERFSGEFHRYIHIPAEVSSEKLSAAFKDGVLKVTLPKSEKSKVKRIPVSSGEGKK